MLKLLAARDPAPVLAIMQQTGILAQALAGAETAGLAALVQCEERLALDVDPLRRLAALGGHSPEVALRLSRKDARALELLRDAPSEPAPVLGYRHGQKTALDLLCLRAAASGTEPCADWPADVARGAAAKFPVRSEDLMPRYQGPALGRRLKTLEERWIASGFALSREDLLTQSDGEI